MKPGWRKLALQTRRSRECVLTAQRRSVIGSAKRSRIDAN
jgi:hypothetical protein